MANKDNICAFFNLTHVALNDGAVDNMEQHEVFVEMITKVDGRARSSASQKVRVPAYTNSIAVPRGQVLRVRDRPERKH